MAKHTGSTAAISFGILGLIGSLANLQKGTGSFDFLTGYFCLILGALAYRLAKRRIVERNINGDPRILFEFLLLGVIFFLTFSRNDLKISIATQPAAFLLCFLSPFPCVIAWLVLKPENSWTTKVTSIGEFSAQNMSSQVNSASQPLPAVQKSTLEPAVGLAEAQERRRPPKSEEEIYALIASELSRGVGATALWTKLYAEANGDEAQTKVLYIRRRAEALMAELATRNQLARINKRGDDYR